MTNRQKYVDESKLVHYNSYTIKRYHILSNTPSPLRKPNGNVISHNEEDFNVSHILFSRQNLFKPQNYFELNGCTVKSLNISSTFFFHL